MELTDIRAVRALLESHGFRLSKALGQNFLVASWVPQRIAAESGVSAADGVLEIGPGVGALTVELAARARRVLCVELDERLRPLLGVTLAACPNVSLHFGDAVKSDLAALCEGELGEKPWRVCANLPYNVTTPLLTALLRAQCFESVTVMIQREVAERVCAAPGSGEYGSFTVLVDWYARAQRLFDVPPECFLPAPKVTSSVVTLTRRAAPPVAVRSEAFFFRVVRAAFNQRRKALPNALGAGLPEVSREQARAALEAMGLPADIRGERLSTLQFGELADRLLAEGKP